MTGQWWPGKAPEQNQDYVFYQASSALITWKQNWMQSHWASLLRRQNKRGENLTVRAKRNPDNGQTYCPSQESTVLQSLQAPLLQFPCSALLPHCSDSLNLHWSTFKQLQTQLCHPCPAEVLKNLLTSWYTTSIHFGTTEVKANWERLKI